MKVSKRDFLKMIGLGAGATVVATNGSALPTDTAIMPLPTVAAVPGAIGTGKICTFPAPMAFWVKTIHVAIAPDTSETDDRLARQFAWQFFGCEKRYAGGPCVIDVQRASIADFMKRKARAPRVSMNFEETKGLYIPSQF